MMKNKIVLLLLLIVINIFAQYALDSKIMSSAALISFKQCDFEEFGTGFFYSDSSSFFLITAKHVIINDIEDTKTKMVVDYIFKDSLVNVLFYSRYADKNPSNLMTLDLNYLYVTGNIIIDPKNDIAVLKIGDQSYKEFPHIEYFRGVERFDSKSVVTNFNREQSLLFDKVEISSDVFIIGYPKTLSLQNSPFFDYNRPLLRKGAIAGKDYLSNSIIIDCPSYGGNSGGPVIAVSNGASYLIGFLIQFIPFEQKWLNLNYKQIINTEISNSGYSIVVPIDKVIEVIKAFK